MIKAGTNNLSILFDPMSKVEASNYRIFETAHLIGVYLIKHLEHKELIKEI